MSFKLEDLVLIKNDKFEHLQKLENIDFKPDKFSAMTYGANRILLDKSSKSAFPTLLPTTSESCIVATSTHNDYTGSQVTISCHVPSFNTTIDKGAKKQQKINIKAPTTYWTQSVNFSYGQSNFSVAHLKHDNKSITTRPLGIGNSDYSICWGNNNRPVTLRAAHNLYWTSPFTAHSAWGSIKNFAKTKDKASGYRGAWTTQSIVEGLLCKSHIDAVVFITNFPKVFSAELSVANIDYTYSKIKVAIALGKFIDNEFKFVVPCKNKIGYCFSLKTLK